MLGEDYKKKMDFLCVKEEETSMDVFTIIVLITLSFGLLCCCTSFCIFCKYKAKTQNAIDDANMAENRVHDPAAAQRILEQ